MIGDKSEVKLSIQWSSLGFFLMAITHLDLMMTMMALSAALVYPQKLDLVRVVRLGQERPPLSHKLDTSTLTTTVEWKGRKAKGSVHSMLQAITTSFRSIKEKAQVGMTS